jgi:hypothetical protein
VIRIGRGRSEGANPGGFLGVMIFQRKNKGRKANPRRAGNEDRQGQVRGGHCGCAQAHEPIGPGGDSAKRRGECVGRNPGPSMLLTSPTQKELRRALRSR